ncbi:ATP-binding protein [Vibrio sp. OCN044]|uniref:histidine kinase n=1 Tax=Vibrio tetraodonis subsp. pristinus TaxID=2695891 RepID=A0A6L8M010_9VIBR|nr:ATP-binding protein [Vibrio tetraodonis]MYM60310.1 ATP-binding protein [Vibrio tetraodonis subsp. pristinus]
MSKRYVSRIGRRVLLILVVISSVITLTTTGLQLYLDYDREFSDVESTHQEIKQVYSGLLATSLWFYDIPSLQKRLEELTTLPKVDYLEVGLDGEIISSGIKPEGSHVTSRFEIKYFDQNTDLEAKVGELSVTSNSEKIYHFLLQQFFISLLLNAVKTFLVCSILFWVFHKSINARVISIVKYLRHYSPRYATSNLQMNNKHWTIEDTDELSWVADEINKLTCTFTKLYQSIKAEQEKLQDFTYVSSDWLWETDNTHRLTFCSDPMRAALGISEDKMPVVHKIQGLNRSLKLQEKLEQKKSFSMCQDEIEFDGKAYYFVFQAIAKYSGDVFVGFRGTAINVSELKQAQLELEKLNHSLEATIAMRTQALQESLRELESTQEKLVESEKMAALGGLVAGVAHEVNTPLGIAVTATSLVEDSLNKLSDSFDNQTLTSTEFTSESQIMDKGLSMLKANLERASILIKDFKSTAVDHISENQSEFNIRQMLEAVLVSLESETKKVPVSIKLIGEREITLNSLSGVLTQVMSHLILNSVYHAFEQTSTPANISISYQQSEHGITFLYQDNGQGIALEDQQKVFEPFYTTKRGSGGSGLGLTLVYNLVNQKLKGEILLESSIGNGVSYKITLPKSLSK